MLRIRTDSANIKLVVSVFWTTEIQSMGVNDFGALIPAGTAA